MSVTVLSSCGDEATEDDYSNQTQIEVSDDSQADPDQTQPDVALSTDTISTTRKPEDDGKDNSKEPCNDLIRKQISSQKGSIDELKEMLAEESDADAQSAMKEEIQVMEKEAEALSLRYDCE